MMHLAAGHSRLARWERMVPYTYIDSVTEDIGGSGQPVVTVHLETGHDVYVAYGCIGVYAAGDLDRMHAGESVEPVAAWDYDGKAVNGSQIVKSFTANTGGGCMVDFVYLTDGVLSLNDECVVYSPYDEINNDCPVCGEWHNDPAAVAECFPEWGDRSAWLYD